MTTKLIMILAVLTALLVSCGDDITCPVCDSSGTDSGSSGITFRSDLKVVFPQDGDSLIRVRDSVYTFLVSWPAEFRDNLEYVGLATSIGIDANGIRGVLWMSRYDARPPENPAPCPDNENGLPGVFFPVLTTNTADTIVGPEIRFYWKSPPPAN